jgi:hypothetical protein
MAASLAVRIGYPNIVGPGWETSIKEDLRHFCRSRRGREIVVIAYNAVALL